jgi:hypothetical protein
MKESNTSTDKWNQECVPYGPNCTVLASDTIELKISVSKGRSTQSYQKKG